MAIHRNIIFFACSDSDRRDRVVLSMYRVDLLTAQGLRTIDYEGQPEDIWFISHSRNDWLGRAVSYYMDYFQGFQSLSFLRQLYCSEGDYNQAFGECCRIEKFNDEQIAEVIKSIDLFFDAILNEKLEPISDLMAVEIWIGKKSEELVANIRSAASKVMERVITEKELDSEWSGFPDFFIFLKLVRQYFENARQEGKCIGYMSNSPGEPPRPIEGSLMIRM
ncbi:hypothetical protein EV700_1807 [Fluviicoccus keumensis]|uniref:Uncharacterized protein n=1 Tax=Fluviicoccus keumensis TaxID=1435465 RepID=A0A4Q7Z3X2_9GAMM|nr:hypothetical protein [Fluviicoccus keumensis]RZU45000.1 hypothetical protein EV700_1807 [Fluviicoccus keumensis]